MTNAQNQTRDRFAAARKKLSSLPEFVHTEFILINHKAEKQRKRFERAPKRLAAQSELNPAS